MGYLTAPPTAASLQIDDRSVQLRSDTVFQCGNTSALIHVTNGLPRFVTGAELAVYGKWDKKKAAFVADSVCGMSTPAKDVTGSAVIDAVLPAADGVTLLSDGRVLRMAAQKRILSIDPPLPDGGAPKPGEWLNYKAHRDQNGRYTVTAAELRLPPFGPKDKHAWKPVSFEAPTANAPGHIRPSHVQGTWVLTAEGPALARLRRVGESVVPAWERGLQADAADKWPITFYLAENHSLQSCASLPNGMIFTTPKTVASLPQDGQLAALLAGCVAQVLEEEALRSKPQSRSEIAAESALIVVVPIITIPAVVLSEKHDGNLLETSQSEQDNRVALTYLAAAGYSVTEEAAAWETLKGKMETTHRSKQPDGQMDRVYKAEAENGALITDALASMQP